MTIVIGVIGGVASGKSAVSEALVGWGAERFDADTAGHDVLRQPAVIAAAEARWGPAVLDSDGAIRRAEVARRVFGAGRPAALEREFLESLTHPRIGEAFADFVASAEARDAAALVVDAALLLEAGWDKNCHVILFVAAADEVRRRRALARGWSEAQWQARESAQWPLPQKRERATHEVTNDSTLSDLRRQLAPLARSWGLAAPQ